MISNKLKYNSIQTSTQSNFNSIKGETPLFKNKFFEMNNSWFSSLLINENRVFLAQETTFYTYCFEFISYLNKDK